MECRRTRAKSIGVADTSPLKAPRMRIKDDVRMIGIGFRGVIVGAEWDGREGDDCYKVLGSLLSQNELRAF